jgi:hypothetical protein
MVRGGSLLILRFLGQMSRSQLLKIEEKLETCFVSARYLKNEMNLGTHMPGGERRKPIDIEDLRTKFKVTTFKNRTKI